MLNTLSQPIRPSHATIAFLTSPLRSPNPQHTLLLIFAQPRLFRFSQHSLAKEIHKMADHDEHKRDRVQEMNPISKNLQANNHAPEVASQQTDIEEGGRSKPVQNRHERIKQRQDERIASQIAAHLPIPHRRPEASTIKNPRLRPIDDHSPPTNLPDHLIQRPLTHQELLCHVAQTIEGRARQREQIAFELLARGDVPAVDTGEVVGGEEDAHAADADDDAEELGPVVADLQEEEGDGDDDDDGPEVDQLRREDGGVAVGEDGEVVALDVAEGEDDVCRPKVSWGSIRLGRM